MTNGRDHHLLIINGTDEHDRLVIDAQQTAPFISSKAQVIAGNVLPGLPMNLLSASHDGSELVVFRDQLEPLLANWGLRTELLREPDHWR